jgi:hypothetical protein
MTMPRGGRRSTSFKKGRSGNPGGKPKHFAELPSEAKAQAVQAIADVKAAARELTPEPIKTFKACMAAANAPWAAKIQAAQSVLDRGWGKAKESIDLTARMSLEDLVLQSMRPHSGDEAGPVIDATLSIHAPVEAVAIPAPAVPPQQAFSLARAVAQSYAEHAAPARMVVPPPSWEAPPTPPVSPAPERPAPAFGDLGSEPFYKRGHVYEPELVRAEPGLSLTSLLVCRRTGS